MDPFGMNLAFFSFPISRILRKYRILEPRFNKLFNEKIITENRHHEDSLKNIKREVNEYEEKTKHINDYYEISKEEIERILKGLKNNKGAGFNDVTNEMYKYGMSDTLGK
ncbi:hypothetical protein BpHYR1_009366 [Brachionus plicatilis]|uniref:Uncharacterized protein n=1 Tax=Brachionus plicatilis TaxID=10195 RepID=A0A3M7QBG3_BRAPC|nr:hypothetical protein BpHYR1_009366 [Brachionus plicatilis]